MDQLQKNYIHQHGPWVLQWEVIHGGHVIRYHDIELLLQIDRLVDLVILLVKNRQRYRRKDKCWRRKVLCLIVMMVRLI